MSNEYRNKVIQGNNLEVLKQIPDNTFDSVVTDPPYGISFMGKKWDYDVPSVETWKEVLRVLKPGGHMLVACGTRTQHRMAINIEDAGFEVRDIVAWVYGSGFPKSMDVSKAIESKLINGNSNKKSFSKLNGERLERGNWGITKNSLVYGFRDKDYTHETDQIDKLGKLEATTDEAKQWQGWGTALKPAMELWTLARKPLIGTVAENVVEYGTGGINIDESRVAFEDTKNPATNPKYRYENNYKMPEKGQNSSGVVNFTSSKNDTNVNGRFPANFIHDGSDEVVSLFPHTKSGKMLPEHKRTTDQSPNGIYGKFDVNHPLSETYGDSGSASRFFYVAKASKKERDFGLYDFDEKQTTDGNIRSNQETARKFGANSALRKNIHPTVKPIELMRYLIKMITPKNGIVLDLYAGSGSTLIAAKLDKFQYVGIEREKEYIDIINARIKAYVAEFDIFDFL